MEAFAHWSRRFFVLKKTGKGRTANAGDMLRGVFCATR